MRKLVFLVLVLALSALGISQDFKTSDRFGKSAEEIARMGHDTWVRWYCDDAQRGANGRSGAELVYCLALHEATQPLLTARSKAEQEFFQDTRAYFADLAKTSFWVGLELTGHSDAWSLPIAESSTAVNEAIWQMLQTKKFLRPGKASEGFDFATQIEAKFQGDRASKLQDAKRFRYLIEKIEKHFTGRPEREISSARSFMVKMGKLALLNPSAT